ncbi:MAG TPA: IclR family transcriptional regulator [Falsiroseomonas sp.]|jgi:DNA-binding IclR family transcriptional regulator|nr:IclR family transcriptional regulator [Falsiroseomonas sp.]
MGKTPAEADRYLVPGLVRGLEVLALFTPETPRLTQAEMAQALGVTRSAVFRVVHTLTELGFLLQEPASGRYALGPALLRLGHGVLPARDVIGVALPVLESLRDETGWSAHLGVLEGTEVVYLLRVPARRGMRSIVHVGSRLPAASTAMGRVLLAGLEEAALADLYRGARFAALAKRARADRARGHVVHLGAFEAGVASAAAPLRDTAGRVAAAINLSAPLDEAPEGRRRAAREAVVAAADAISRSLGWAGG